MYLCMCIQCSQMVLSCPTFLGPLVRAVYTPITQLSLQSLPKTFVKHNLLLGRFYRICPITIYYLGSDPASACPSLFWACLAQFHPPWQVSASSWVYFLFQEKFYSASLNILCTSGSKKSSIVSQAHVPQHGHSREVQLLFFTMKMAVTQSRRESVLSTSLRGAGHYHINQDETVIKPWRHFETSHLVLIQAS